METTDFADWTDFLKLGTSPLLVRRMKAISGGSLCEIRQSQRNQWFLKEWERVSSSLPGSVVETTTGLDDIGGLNPLQGVADRQGRGLQRKRAHLWPETGGPGWSPLINPKTAIETTDYADLTDYK